MLEGGRRGREGEGDGRARRLKGHGAGRQLCGGEFEAGRRRVVHACVCTCAGQWARQGTAEEGEGSGREGRGREEGVEGFLTCLGIKQIGL